MPSSTSIASWEMHLRSDRRPCRTSSVR
jgi:hypothetical protein